MSRGGRGGRGGGRGGVNKSFNHEQLAALGISSSECKPLVVTQPPPLYPLLDKRPVPLHPSIDLDYLLILKQDFVDHMQLSSSYLRMPPSKTNNTEQNVDQIVVQLPNTREKYDWSLFPSELRPKLLAKRVKVKVEKDVNVEQRLNVLEKMEAGGKVKEENDDEDENNEIVEEEDAEMDDGTDYANNYFENGEDYEDEDDNLDDGTIY